MMQVDGVARNEALKSYQHALDNGYSPRSAMDGAIREYVRRAACEAAKPAPEPAGDVREKQAWDFRLTLVPKADAYNGNAPMWHGWAIFDAFIAGWDAALSAPASAKAAPGSGVEA